MSTVLLESKEEIVRKTFARYIASLILACCIPNAQPATIHTVGTIADLNGNGTADEQAEINRHTSFLSGILPAAMNFTLSVNFLDLPTNPAEGTMTSFDSNGYANAGFVSIDLNLSGGWSWYVRQPGETGSPDPVYPFMSYGPSIESARDFGSMFAHELIHAVLMVDRIDNWRYQSHLKTIGGKNYADIPGIGLVPLAGADRSHFAVVGTEGKGRTLMDSPRLINNGRVVFTHYDPITLALLRSSLPLNDGTAPVPEPSTWMLAAAGATLALTKMKKG